MDSFFFAVKDQIYQTMTLTVEFYRKVPILPALVVLAVVFFVFFRRWETRKIISLFFTLFFLSLLFVRVENFFIHAPMSPEGSDMAVGITRIVTAIIAVIVFLYHASVSQ